MLNLDTHILIALLAGELTPREEKHIVTETLAISDIVLWELAKLSQMRRLQIDFDSSEFRQALRSISVVPITLEIARISTQLDFKSGPEDEIIAATSIVEKLPLLTRDRSILRSRIVPFAR
ncbi:MAG TPA: PIN domain-containing protein [Acidobacteriota bacterium]|jgi:PIN domain nuclease of toxin-antitoxin system